jgi:hypothetical protein
MAAYLGTEGWCLTTELKAGSENGQLGFGFVLDRILPYARTLTKLPLLLRLDSGHDALENRVRADAEEVDFIVKWNPRKESSVDVLARAESLGHRADWSQPRPGKRIAIFTEYVERRWQRPESRRARDAKRDFPVTLSPCARRQPIFCPDTPGVRHRPALRACRRLPPMA